MAHDLRVTLNVHDVNLCPPLASVADVLGAGRHARVELLPRFAGPASAVSSVPIGPVAGSWRPNDWADDPSIRRFAVNLCKLAGAYYFPRYGVLVDRDGNAPRAPMAQATYATPDLRSLPGMRYVDDTLFFSPPDDLETLSDAVVTMPWGARSNYGHFVCDCLTTVAALRDHAQFRDAVYVFPPLKPWHQEHLGLLGLEPHEVPGDVYYMEQAFFTNCMDTFLNAPNVVIRHLAQLELSAAGCASAWDGPQPGRKLWISRGHEKRRFLSQDAIESALVARDFEIVTPETLSVVDQIRLFASASLVVAPTGAAFANLIYCAPGTAIVELIPEGIPAAWVRNLCLLGSCRWAPYFCPVVSRTPVQVADGARVRPELGVEFDVDHADFLRHVDRVTALAP